MADTNKYVAGKKYKLSGSGVTSTATSIVLQSFTLPDDAETAITMSDFGGVIGYGTLEPKTSKVEFISFTGVTQNANGTATLTGVTRGLKFNSDYSADTSLRKAHSGGALFIISNPPQFYNKFAAKDNEETITQVWTFSATPQVSNSPVNNTDVVNKAYVLSVVTGGTITTNQILIAGNAGENVSAGNLVYLDAADGEWKKCDADTAATVENINLGIAQGSGTDGNPITNGVLIYGLDTTQSGLTDNTKYYASNTAGAISTSAGTKEVTVGISRSTTSLFFCPRFDQAITEDIQDALTPGGVYGTPSASNPYLTKDYNASATGLPVVHVLTANTPIGSSTTRFDITNIVGNTYRYTWDGTGTDPSISVGTFPIGTIVDIQAQNFSSGNKGLFVTTGVGSNYFEISNASGVAENDKTIGTGYIVKGATWTKPSALKYITIEQVGAGAAGEGGSGDSFGMGGASGGYAKKLIATADLASTINYCVGYKATGTTSSSTTVAGRTIFNHSSPIITTGGTGSTTPGSASGGDINIAGQKGSGGIAQPSAGNCSGFGASTLLGLGGAAVTGSASGEAATGYGAGGGGFSSSSGSQSGGDGANGVIILTEYFS